MKDFIYRQIESWRRLPRTWTGRLYLAILTTVGVSWVVGTFGPAPAKAVAVSAGPPLVGAMSYLWLGMTLYGFNPQGPPWMALFTPLTFFVERWREDRRGQV